MKRNPFYNYNRLPMENAFNVRELGGYAASGGKITKYHQFLRTENLSNITEADKQFLIDYGVKAAIDLRGREEAVIYPSPFRDHELVEYINLPFITNKVLDMRMVKEKGFRVDEFYIKLVEYKEMVFNIMEFILKYPKGAVMFHCQAGKDRTGILAMLLLGVCGVAKEDIIANYEVTHTYLKDHVELRLDRGLEELQYSRPQWIERAYDYIIEEYGSFSLYLRAAGLSRKQIKQLKKKLIG